MKKIFTIFFLILFISGIFAVEININEEYSQGETLIAKISGNFLTPLTRNNIFFYEEHVRIPFEYGLTKIDSDYYLYVILVGKKEGNYSLSIENIKYMIGGNINDENIIKNFSITNQIADFSITPGFVSTSENFSLTFQNLKSQSLDININTENFERNVFISTFNTKETSINLKSGEIKKINFIIEEGETIFQEMTISSENLTYEVPVYILGIEKSSEMPKKSFDFQNSDLIISLPLNSIHKEKIYLYNKNNVDLEDISISLSDSLSSFAVISSENIEKIESNSNVSIELSLFSEEEKKSEGYIYASSENESVSLFISVNFLKNTSNVVISSPKTCAELNGTIYDTETQSCSQPTNAKDGWCCLGEVNQIQENNSGRIIAVILILIMVVGLIWFYFKKYKQSKKPVDLLKISKGKH